LAWQEGIDNNYSLVQQDGIAMKWNVESKGTSDMATEENKSLIRQFVAAADRQDFEQASACLSPDVLVHLPGMPAPLDFPTFLGFGQMWHTAFPDEQTSFEQQMAEGDMVVSRMVSKATHLGDFRGIPATGKPVEISGIWIDRVDHGRIAERWGVMDMLTLMEQLGVMTN
jgi:steroid delta-isomerase-like uncharacterized protein